MPRITWREFHGRMLVYNGDGPAMMAYLYNDVPKVLFCLKCEAHYIEYLAKDSPDLTSVETLWQWSYRLHDAVNVIRGDPRPSIETARAVYTSPPLALSPSSP